MKRVDTCAAEFEAGTPYMYSSYDGECECDADSNPKVRPLGGLRAWGSGACRGRLPARVCCAGSPSPPHAHVTPTPPPSPPPPPPQVLILGGGPNRIGQGIEFDYCCCHASFSLRDAG